MVDVLEMHFDLRKGCARMVDVQYTCFDFWKRMVYVLETPFDTRKGFVDFRYTSFDFRNGNTF